MSILNVLVSILALALMIFVHELGHYTAGRILKFKILDFSLGFGPALIKFKKKDTTYALRLIPLGGACQFYGEDDEAVDGIAFNAQKVWKRIIVVLAGPLMNVLFAYLLAVVMMFSYGVEKAYTYDNGVEAVTIVDFAAEDSPAENSGIEKGDWLLAIDGQSIPAEGRDYEGQLDICSELIADAPAEGVSVTVLRNGEEHEIFVSNIYNEEMDANFFGISMGYETYFEPYGFFESFGEAGKLLFNVLKLTFEGIGNMFSSGIHQGDVTGVVGTVAIMSNMASIDFYYLLYVVVLISLNLGVFNLLPIPALDGGRLVFMLIELIAGKPVNRKVEATIHAVGLILLFGLMIVITVFDVIGIRNGLFG